MAQTMACSVSMLSLKIQILFNVKINADCPDSCKPSDIIRLSRQLQTVADCQDNCRQLQTIENMSVLVCSVKLSVRSVKGGGMIVACLPGTGHSKKIIYHQCGPLSSSIKS